MISTSLDDRILDIQSKLLNRNSESTSTSIVINGLMQFALKHNPKLDEITKAIEEVKRSDS